MATPYEALVEAAASLVDTTRISEGDPFDLSDARAFLRRNRATLESARRSLGPECAVAVRYEESFFAQHSTVFPSLRHLALAFAAEASLMAHEHDYAAATQAGLDILELANAVRRGGLVTDLLVGDAIGGIAVESLRKNRAHIDQTTRRFLMRELQRLDAQREPFADIVARDRRWEAAVAYEEQQIDLPTLNSRVVEESGMSGEEFQAVVEAIHQIAKLPEPEKHEVYLLGEHRMVALMRMLVIDLALRDSYESSGSWPNRLASLAPEPLPEVPIDPFTGASFLYRQVHNRSYQLYSTGPKMRDGGGIPGPWPLVMDGQADLFLDFGDYDAEWCGDARKGGAAS